MESAVMRPKGWARSVLDDLTVYERDDYYLVEVCSFDARARVARHAGWIERAVRTHLRDAARRTDEIEDSALRGWIERCAARRTPPPVDPYATQTGAWCVRALEDEECRPNHSA